MELVEWVDFIAGFLYSFCQKINQLGEILTSSLVNNTEYSLEAFLGRNEAELPPKGALVRIFRRDALSTPAKIQDIVFSGVESILCKSPPIPYFCGRLFHKRKLVGLDLDRDYQKIIKYGEAFYGEDQLVDMSTLHRFRDPAYTSLDTISVIVSNYFEYRKSVTKEVGSSLMAVMSQAPIGLVQEYIS